MSKRLSGNEAHAGAADVVSWSQCERRRGEQVDLGRDSLIEFALAAIGFPDGGDWDEWRVHVSGMEQEQLIDMRQSACHVMKVFFLFGVAAPDDDARRDSDDAGKSWDDARRDFDDAGKSWDVRIAAAEKHIREAYVGGFCKGKELRIRQSGEGVAQCI